MRLKRSSSVEQLMISLIWIISLIFIHEQLRMITLWQNIFLGRKMHSEAMQDRDARALVSPCNRYSKRLLRRSAGVRWTTTQRNVCFELSERAIEIPRHGDSSLWNFFSHVRNCYSGISWRIEGIFDQYLVCFHNHLLFNVSQDVDKQSTLL